MALTDLAGPVPPRPDKIHWITTPEELDQWLKQHSDQPLALDTEFERVSTFFPIPGLVQLGREDRYCLVDPDVAEQSQEFRRQLEDADTCKLLYAMSEDLELFRHWLKVMPAGMVDLQIGAALAGAGFSLGYARIVETLFGAELDKSVTRSDWISRPLSEAQQRYALDDVRFLMPMYQWEKRLLEERGLWEALAEESSRFASELAAQDDPGQHYLKLRGAWTLSENKQKILRELVTWRENMARQKDRPRSRVVPDAVLIGIADQLPDSSRRLSAVPEIAPGIVRRYADEILAIVATDPDTLPPLEERIMPPLSREQQMLYKRIKKVVVRVAEARDIPIELLAPRKRLEAMIHASAAGEDPFTGWLFTEQWRRELLLPVRNEIEELLAS